MKLKTNTFLITPSFTWYFKYNSRRNLYPFVQLEGGFGSTTVLLKNEDGYIFMKGKGNGVNYGGSIGFEAGSSILFHMRVGYRFYDPKIDYSTKMDEMEIPELNLSGFFMNAGVCILLSKLN